MYVDLVITAIAEARKLRQICVCGRFNEAETPEYDYSADFVRCQNCGGWMSGQRLVSKDVK